LNSNFFYFILILINVTFSEDYSLSIDKYNLNQNPRNNTFTHLFGIIVEFQVDNNPETSGNGKFINDESLDLTYINHPNINRCNQNSKLVIDLPPHNSDYFLLQMESVKNYYKSVSNNNINFDNIVLNKIPYELSNTMSYYSTSDQKIGTLFAEAIELASLDIENYINQNTSVNSIDDVLFVVFHAGLGQEASQDFDPTIYDIRSAYIDENMLSDVQQNEYWINDNNVTNGLVMPETLNWISYDVIEDIFPNTFINVDELENLYCGIQIGMTGLFAHLLGYHFGFPVMSDVQTGNTRIGKFGLMDVGWSNQSGIIPPRPNPWTRSNNSQNVLGWVTKNNQTEEMYISGELDIDINVVNDENDEILQLSISEDEYFLLENRSNRIDADNQYSNMSINDMINYYSPYDDDYNADEDDFINLFDVVEHYSNLNNYDFFEIDPDYHVITKVKNYDYGLPGSGILIWHIDEPSLDEYNSGINNDLNNKSVSIEEGDGIEHIGNPNYYLFNDLSKGNESDFWYSGNEFYQYINYQGYDNQAYLGEDIFFNNESIPNSRLKNNTSSSISVEINDNISNNMNISISYINSDYDVVCLGEGTNVIGNSKEGCVFYIFNNDIYEKCINQDQSQLFQDDFIYGDINSLTEESRILVDVDYNLYLVENQNFYLNENSQISDIEDNLSLMGYYNDLGVISFVEDALSLGDVDGDGLDERLIIDNGNLYCYNSNNTICEGFPVFGNFKGTPLIVDIIDNGNNPEIICQNDNVISIMSNKGDDILENIPNFSNNQNIYVMSGWEENKAAIINGNMLFIFNEYNALYSYWENPFSTTYNYPIVTGSHIENTEDLDIGIDLLRTYNYPNPINDGYTKFRFFVYEALKVSINIYDASGVLVDKLKLEELVNNEYNEINWNASRFDSGLYFAEIKSEIGQSKLIKVVIL